VSCAGNRRRTTFRSFGDKNFQMMKDACFIGLQNHFRQSVRWKWIDSMPEKEFTVASVSRIDDTRNHVEADVDVSGG